MSKEKIEDINFKRVFLGNSAWDDELEIAINDLLEDNKFSVKDWRNGPYRTKLDIVDNRISLGIEAADKETKISIPTSPFRRIIKDYFILFDSYEEAMNLGHHGKIEAIDMGRRSLHNEGAETLIDLLDEKIEVNLETARRLFTIITVLHLK